MAGLLLQIHTLPDPAFSADAARSLRG